MSKGSKPKRKPPQGPFLCYAIRHTHHTKRSYCGQTNNFARRIRQHRKEISGGARYTRTKADTKGRWEPIFHVVGFQTLRAVLQFEIAMKKRSRGSAGRIHQLEYLLSLGQFNAEAHSNFKQNGISVKVFIPLEEYLKMGRLSREDFEGRREKQGVPFEFCSKKMNQRGLNPFCSICNEHFAFDIKTVRHDWISQSDSFFYITCEQGHNIHVHEKCARNGRTLHVEYNPVPWFNGNPEIHLPIEKTYFELYDATNKIWTKKRLDELQRISIEHLLEVIEREKADLKSRQLQTQREMIAWLLCSKSIPRDIRKLIGSYIMRPPYAFPRSINTKIYISRWSQSLIMLFACCVVSIVLFKTLPTTESTTENFITMCIPGGLLFIVVFYSIKFIKPML